MIWSTNWHYGVADLGRFLSLLRIMPQVSRRLAIRMTSHHGHPAFVKLAIHASISTPHRRAPYPMDDYIRPGDYGMSVEEEFRDKYCWATAYGPSEDPFWCRAEIEEEP